jgi:hypothetical protein
MCWFMQLGQSVLILLTVPALASWVDSRVMAGK